MKNYTFYVDKNARFADGDEVTGEDETASLLAAMSGGYYVGRFSHVKSISNTRDGGVFIQLDTPYENLPILLDIPIVKKEHVEKNEPVGSGPYVLRKNGNAAVLYRNSSWWCKAKLPIDQDIIQLSPIEGADSAGTVQIRDQFEFSDVGLVCADPCTFNYADFRCDFELWDCDNGILMYLGCNILYSEGDLFLKRNLRSTLTYAIDRNKINEEVFRGFGRPTTLAADPNSPYYIPSLAERYEYRPLKFVEALGGYWITKPVRLLVNSDDRLRLATARKIAEMLTEHGMTTVTIEKSTQDYLAHIRTANYELFLGKTRLSATMDLSQFFKPWGENSYNGITDPATLDLCKAALDNHGNYYTLLEHVAEDARIVPIMFYGYSVYGTRGLLSDLRPSRDTVFFYTLGKTMDDIQLPTYYA
jgi:peptide/nickel transport system substrate-binding protein